MLLESVASAQDKVGNGDSGVQPCGRRKSGCWRGGVLGLRGRGMRRKRRRH